MLGVVAFAQPALADTPIATLGVTAPTSFNSGDSHDIAVQVTNGGMANGESVTVSLDIAKGGTDSTDFSITGVSISGASSASCASPSGPTCVFSYDGSSSFKVTFTVKATGDDAPAGGTTVFDGSSVTLKDTDTSLTPNTATAGFSVTLNGPVPANTTISGEVDDITTGKPVSGALVNLQDSANPAHSYNAHTDSKGKFSFPVDATHPVVAGQVFAGATKNGYKTHIGQPVNFTPGTPISGWKLLVTPIATPTPSTASVTPSGLPSGAPSAAASGAPSGAGSQPASGGASLLSASGSGGGSDLFKYVLIGGLILILAGTAVMVIMFIRRRRADDGGEDGGYQPDYEPPYDPSPGPVRGGPVDQPTMVHSAASTMAVPRRPDYPTQAVPGYPQSGPAYPYQQSGPAYGSPGPTYAQSGPPYPPAGPSYPPAPAYAPPAPRPPADPPYQSSYGPQPGRRSYQDQGGYPQQQGYDSGYPPAGGAYGQGQAGQGQAGQGGGYGAPPGNPRAPYPDQGSQHGYGDSDYPAYPPSAPRGGAHSGQGYQDPGYDAGGGYQQQTQSYPSSQHSYDDQGYQPYQQDQGLRRARRPERRLRPRPRRVRRPLR